MKRITVGIDPGISGAYAVLGDAVILRVGTMPIEAKATRGNRIDARALIETFNLISYDFYGKVAEVPLVAIEQVSAMPGQGVSSMFSLGDSFGCARMAASMTGARIEIVSPVSWKRAVRLIGKTKKYSLTRCYQMFPALRKMIESNFNQAQRMAIAEAALIAYYAYKEL